MDDNLHFDGDPEVDSSRRHLERVIKGYPPRRRWPWILAAFAGGGAWAIWRNRQPPGDGAASTSASGPQPASREEAVSGSSDPAVRS